MFNVKWTVAEKKIARRAYDKALDRAPATAVADFKARAAAVTTPEEMWVIGEGLHRQQRELDQMFDYRYSQLLFVFPQLIREGYLEEAELAGLSDEKMDEIRFLLSRWK